MMTGRLGGNLDRGPRGFRRAELDDKGFSYIEMLTALVLASIFLGGVVQTMSTGQESFEANSADAAIRQNTRIVLDWVARDLRLAGYHDIEEIGGGLLQASPWAISIAGDIDNGDKARPCTGEASPRRGPERVMYRLSRGRLRRRVDCWSNNQWRREFKWENIATGVKGDMSLFRYFRADGMELVPTLLGLSAAQRNEVVAVLVTLHVEDTAVDRIYGPDEHPEASLTTRVRMRNLEMGTAP